MTVQALSETVLELSDGRLYALAHPYELDGRPVSTHPARIRGFSQFNSYLLVDGDQAVLVDTGMPIHAQDLVAQLESVLAPGSTLSLVCLRISEFSSVSNARTLAERFQLGDIIGGLPSPHNLNRYLDFEGGWREPTGEGRLAAARRRGLVGQRDIVTGDDRVLKILRPNLQFLPTYWLFDGATGTMFTSDSFTHVWRPSAAGPWSTTRLEDGPSAADIAGYLVDTRYWWLAGADTAPLRRQLAEILAGHDICCIAPAFGCVLRGREVATHHFELMDRALADLGERDPIGPDLLPDYVTQQ